MKITVVTLLLMASGSGLLPDCACAQELAPPPDARRVPGAEQVSFTAGDGVQVFADLHRAQTGPAAPLILLFHQGGADARGEYHTIIKRLADSTYNVLAVDLRVGGDVFQGVNRTVRNLPANRTYTFCQAYPDLEAALSFARSSGFTGPIVAWGSSFSAALVFQLAARHQTQLSALLAFSPAAGGPMEECRPDRYLAELRAPALALRPGSEMGFESTTQQWANFAEHGVETYVAANGVHGSSMLVPARIEGSAEEHWSVVLAFLRKALVQPNEVVPKVVVGANRRVTSQDSSLHHVEPDLAVSPLNANQWLIGAMVAHDPGRIGTHCAVWASADAGTTWTRTDFPELAADPDVAFDAGGHAFFSCLGAARDPGGFYHISSDQGVKWSAKRGIGRGHDHPFLGGTGNVMYWVSSYRGNTQLDVRSSRGGTPFSEPTVVSPSQDTYLRRGTRYQHDNLVHAVWPNGDLALPYVAYYIGPQAPIIEAAYLITSSDSGRSFSAPRLITRKVGSTKGMGRVLIDTSHTRFRNSMYLVYGIGQGRNEHLGIGMSISRDQGDTWRDVVVQPPIPEGNRFMTPTAAVNKDGTIGLYWYDRRHDPERIRSDIFFAASVDGGLTFTRAQRVTEVSFTTCCSTGDSAMAATFPGGGHYSGIAALPDGSFQLLWSDSRSGKYQLYTSNVRVTLPG